MNNSADQSINNTIPFKLRFFSYSSHIFSKILNILAALHNGFWLGILNQASTNALTETFYNKDQIYREFTHNLGGLHLWEKQALSQYFNECESILIGATGGGRELLSLAKEGKEVDGFECNSKLAKSCADLIKQHGFKARIVKSLADQVPQEFGIYDGAILGWGAYMHISSRVARVKLLQAFKKHLYLGSPILLSFSLRPDVDNYHNLVYIEASTIRKLTRSSEPIELGDSLTYSFEHRFTEHEVRSELEEAGFETVFFSKLPYFHAVGIVKG